MKGKKNSELIKTNIRILKHWNDTKSDFPDICVHRLFENQMHISANSVSIRHGKKIMTYCELDERANQLANYLIRNGVKTGSLIGICVGRSFEMIIAMLAVLKSGAAYIPIDAQDPRDRIEFIISDASINFLLTDAENGVLLKNSSIRQIHLERDWKNFSEFSKNAPEICVKPDDLAYVIYTSGSTGKPKGVAMEHRSLTNLLWWHKEKRPQSCGLKTLQFCAVSFDFSFHEIFSTICFGGTLVLIDENVRSNPFLLANFISENKIEKLFLPVTALNQLVKAVNEEKFPFALKEVITTGESLKITPLIADFFRRSKAVLHNHYGATEFQDAATFSLKPDDEFPSVCPIGRPLDNVRIYILDEFQKSSPIGEIGELCIGGVGLAREYLNRPLLNREKFIKNPFGDGRLYRTGDLARFRGDGIIEHLGRIDNQVKIHGARIELEEIEVILSAHRDVRECAVKAFEDGEITRLTAFIVPHRQTDFEELKIKLHDFLTLKLPARMIPDDYVVLESLPLTSSGKLDSGKLLLLKKLQWKFARKLPLSKSEIEKTLTEIWKDVLKIEAVGIDENFFEVGGTSLHLLRVYDRINKFYEINLSTISLFQYPTIKSFSEFLSGNRKPAVKNQRRIKTGIESADIAVIGMAGRFPGADDLQKFWGNLRDGVESITVFSEEEVSQTDSRLLHNPQYVRAGAILSGIENFDASFFDFSAKEAALIDPQQRILMELAWEAFENAGYDPTSDCGLVGVFAGSSISTYLINNLSPFFGFNAGRPFIEADTLQFQLKVGNDRNYLPTRISYKLNLRGPSINVQTACSTSLVAAHLACRSLLNNECRMALAGGISITVPSNGGYLFEEGMIRSPDGHCRAFDEHAAGTLFGNGGGLILLKRLDEAISDRDNILAVIKGSAVNNDGSQKVSFTAPNIESQVAVIEDALENASVDSDTVTYIEAHGTGTSIGDPIEVSALTQAFADKTKESSPRKNGCLIGSVKTNIGHLDEAAGIAGLIKTILALQHKIIPPSLNFEKPNPKIDFENSPFAVNTVLKDWQKGDFPRRAGVSSFGMGGTNCHLILEESLTPLSPASEPESGRLWQILALSARTADALRETVRKYLTFLRDNPEISLADICFTANAGRKHFEHRFAFIAETKEDAIRQLESFAASPPNQPFSENPKGKIAFLYTGQGSQYANMGKNLYETQPVFRQAIEDCDEILRPYLSRSLLSVLFPSTKDASLIDRTEYTQPVLFAFEYALTQVWKSWGIEPDIVIGHSLGEYSAACAAGVFNLETGLKFTAERGRMMQETKSAGEMISAAANEETVAEIIRPFLSEVSVAAINSATDTVISGQKNVVETICEILRSKNISFKKLNVSQAFHSPLTDGLLESFGEIATKVSFSEPNIVLISNLTGKAVTEEITDFRYWVEHVRKPVRFFSQMTQSALLDAEIFIEIGPQPTLLAMGRKCLPESKGLWLPSIRPEKEWSELLTSLRSLYLTGRSIDWKGFDKPYLRKRVALPTYPWQKKRHWIEVSETHSSFQFQQKNHPLLGERLRIAQSDKIRFESVISKKNPRWLSDHQLFQTVIMPGVAYLEMILAAGTALLNTKKLAVTDFFIHQAMDLPDDIKSRRVQTILKKLEDEEYEFQIFSQAVSLKENEWTLHASGKLKAGNFREITTPSVESLANLRLQFTGEISPAQIYQGEREREIDLGQSFYATENIWQNGNKCLSKISLPEIFSQEVENYEIHPVLLEASLLALTVTYPEKYGRKTYVPLGVEKIYINHQREKEFFCYAELHPSVEENPQTLTADISLFSMDGRLIFLMNGVLLKIARRRSMLKSSGDLWKNWLYKTVRQDWKPRNPKEVLPKNRRWLILADQFVAPELAKILNSKGSDCALLFLSKQENTEKKDFQAFYINEKEPDSFDALLEKLPEFDEVVDCWSFKFSDTDNPHISAITQGENLLQTVQTLVRQEKAPRLWLISLGAQAVNEFPARDLSQTIFWGMARVIEAEHPELRLRQIDLDPDATVEESAKSLFSAITALFSEDTDGENILCFRETECYVPRLKRYKPQTDAENVVKIKLEGSYLITGGAGGIGLEVSRFLAEKGARHMILLGRGKPDSVAVNLFAELKEKGTQIHFFQADVSVEKEVAEVLGKIKETVGLPALRGIIHLAGVLNDGAIMSQSLQKIEQVFLPKIAGVWNLHKLTTDYELDFFVCFSSISSLLGATGQFNYAGANSFLDGFASYRRALGLPFLSINWGSWAEIGMSARLRLEKRLEENGEGIIPVNEGLKALEFLLENPQNESSIAVLPVDWTRFLRNLASVSAFLGDFYDRKTEISANDFSRGSIRDIRKQLNSASFEERKILLEKHVREHLLQILGKDVVLNPDTGFFSLGMDSLTSIELRNRLQTSLGVSLGLTLAFDFPTQASLVNYLLDQKFGTGTDNSEISKEKESAETLPGEKSASDDIARRLAEKLGIEVSFDE